MAWHDNNWDGNVCQHPEQNTYCIGVHSLLSGRIEKRRDLEAEMQHKGEMVGGNFEPAQVPPCYWSINAFSESGFKIEHRHAFSDIKETIPDEVKPNSVYTWPFKLSFVHSESNQKRHGNYPPNLESRIDKFLNKFEPHQSIVFFYANYDNPVSADEMKYLLLGSSVLSEYPITKHFQFDPEWLTEFRLDKKMKNFPTINWAIQLTHDPSKSVLLPYREYIKYAAENPEDEEKLHDMKVVIEEESLIRSFKYVAMDIDDDKCLYLLYKIRKSIKKIQEHNQLVIKSDLQEEEKRITDLIKMVWQKRGIYPSLNKILRCFLDDENLSDSLAKSLISHTSKEKNMGSLFDEIFNEDIPQELMEYEADLLDLIDRRLFKKNIGALLKLSLFNLTEHQIKKIINRTDLLSAIGINPYALYEEYQADEEDLDEPEMQDEVIDIYKVDVGMIPDRKFVKRHRELQNLNEDSPERVRSVIINYLWEIGNHGHCYDHIYNILNEIKEYPLIYKNDINLDEKAIINLDNDYKSHFVEKLYITESEGERYFYLTEIKNAEDHLKDIVNALIYARADYQISNIDYEKHIADSLNALCKVITTEKEKQSFIEERTQLYRHIFSESLFLLTGRPGTGKTHEIIKIINYLSQLNEECLLLAPTGKATLRLTENIVKYTSLKLVAQTIDRFIFNNGFGWAYDDWERLRQLPHNEKITVENLVIDESSMVDLQKLHILLSIIRFDEKYPKRVILVGDENQLPPIGFGKPFHDIINYIIADEQLFLNHYVNLRTNCRQENDERIIKLAEAFIDKKRYYEESLELIEAEGKVSDGLFIYKWNSQDELHEKLNSSIDNLFRIESGDEEYDEKDCKKRLNTLFGLYENGYVNNQNFKFKETLTLEELQILTPYRAGYYGTIGTNKLIQENYRDHSKYSPEKSSFYHSDKIIRLENWYQGRGHDRKLLLSNGSIGIVNGEWKQRKYYFKEIDKPLFWVDSEERFDLAYSITIHKSQGSDFKNVFLIIPNKLTLLSKELLYTALTRSKFRLFIFIYKAKDNLFLQAKNISYLLNRNTSVFEEPQDTKKKFFPVPGGKPVRSKVEYIIHTALQKSGLQFEYEQQLNLEKRHYPIHPDFTIKLKGGHTIYWEHLGKLDIRKYYGDWQDRKQDYNDHNLFEYVVTTDDLEGIKYEKIDHIIDDIRNLTLRKTKDSKFSNHHYELY